MDELAPNDLLQRLNDALAKRLEGERAFFTPSVLTALSVDDDEGCNWEWTGILEGKDEESSFALGVAEKIVEDFRKKYRLKT